MPINYKVDIYTDGSSLISGNNYESSSGFIIYIDNVKTYSCGFYHPNGTISIGELYSIACALDKVSDILKDRMNQSTISIYSDSEYTIKSLSQWIYNWDRVGENNIWYGSSGKEVMYQHIMKYIHYNYTLKYKGISYHHIRGHIGEKVPVEKAYAYYNKNNPHISIDEFMMHSKRNKEADVLADKVRVKKLSYYEEIEGSNLWGIRKRNTLTRNGKILILRN